jgi:hypothetical protein
MTSHHIATSEFYQNLFIEGDWFLSDTNAALSTVVHSVLVGTEFHAKLVLRLESSLMNNTSESKHSLAEDIILHLLSRVNVHFETSFVKRIVSVSEPSSTDDMVVPPFPNAVYQQRPPSADSPHWSWEADGTDSKDYTGDTVFSIRFIRYISLFIGKFGFLLFKEKPLI